MAVIQFSIPTDVLLDLVATGKRTGLSEHQVAKFLMLTAFADTSDAAIMEQYIKARQPSKDKSRATPIG